MTPAHTQTDDTQTEPFAAFRLATGRPFPWRRMLRYLGARLVPGREHILKDVYVRTLSTRAATLEIGYDASGDVLRLRPHGPVDPSFAAARAARLFGLDDAAVRLPFVDDPILGPRLATCPGLRPLGCWDPFELCVRTLVGQQVSVKAAQSLTVRLVERCGALTPKRLAHANLDRIGMPGRRVSAIQQFAAAVDRGRFDLDAPWPDLADRLARQPGFGPWTRAYLAIRLGRDPDAFPATDVGLLRATGQTSGRALAALAERWRPWRAYAATYLWMVAPDEPDARP